MVTLETESYTLTRELETSDRTTIHFSLVPEARKCPPPHPLVSVDESKHAAWNNHNEKYPLTEDRFTKFFHFAAHIAYGSLVTVVENVM